MTDTLEGGCACGAVRYRLLSAPMFVHCCHCRDCQRQTGSAFVINALIETDRIALLSGSPEAAAVPTDSGRPHHIYTRTKLPWVALPAGVPAFEAYYDSSKLWPAASLERRRAILG